ncbi:MAG: flagellar export protein FliJ [Candidatus Marinimicrobia bacterium]|nr:flagellar export protein FliJ [Candidatus Neomarinimicrobiota bacterium]|tara:strand:- start:5334 stop:5774 length:441 start_codon:yes stop_codon:yes gene_type:complete
MTFKFSYQKILDVKQIQEDQKSLEVVSAQNELEKEKDELSELEKEKLFTLKNSENNSQNSLDLMRKNSFINSFNQNIDKQKLRIKKTKEILSSKKDELLNASKSRKIMDKLKESHLKKFNIEQNRIEQNQIDEIGANIALKNKGNR